ncbi:MAG: alpha/beta fold hydrolase [Gammaproteobacteria bacterium]
MSAVQKINFEAPTKGHAVQSNEEIRQATAKLVDKAIARNLPGLQQLPTTESELDVGCSAKTLVHTEDTARLYHYEPLCEEIYRVPVMIIMSPVAKGYILDLAKGQSFIEYLLLQGHDVFMLEWVEPRRNHASLTLTDYVSRLVGNCVDKVVENTGEPDVTLIGYCMGGMLATMYAATSENPAIKNLACFTTPYNADGMELYKRWVDAGAVDLDRLINELGNLPGDIINNSLQALRPLQKTAGQMQLLNNVENDAFVKAHLRFDHWATNQLAIPGELAREMFDDFLRDNKFYKNEYLIGDRKADLSKITVPFLHVAAEYDHIVPAAASRGLVEAVSSKDKEEIVVKGGHVSLVAGGNAVYRLWPQLDKWLSKRAV